MMSDGSVREPSGNSFRFPFPPYAVQIQLMSAVYDTLSSGGVGIFESPTGTGKSLSLICSSLRWLNENPVYVQDQQSDPSGELHQDVPKWVLDHVKKREEEEKQRSLEREKERLSRARKKMAEDAVERRKKASRGEVLVLGSAQRNIMQPNEKKRSLEAIMGILPVDSKKEDRLLLSEEEHDDDSLKALIRDVLGSENDEVIHEDEMDVRKIIYCSRTHSQLSQFMREVN